MRNTWLAIVLLFCLDLTAQQTTVGCQDEILPSYFLLKDPTPSSVFLSRPQPGQIFTDPVFGTKIVRITDDTATWAHLHTYNAFSLDNRWLYYYRLQGMGQILSRFDPVTMSATTFVEELGRFPNGATYRPTILAWSTTNPNKGWTVAGLRIGYWDLTTFTHTVVADFTGQLPAGTTYLVFRSMSSDERRFCVQTQDATYAYTGMAVLDVVTNQVVYHRSSPGIKPDMDQSGRWVVTVIPDGIIDVDTGTVQPMPPNFVWHMGFGNGVTMGPDSNRQDIRKFFFTDLSSIVLKAQTPSTDWSQGTHMGINATLDGNWICISRFRQTARPPLTPQFLRDEVALIATDGSGTVKHLAHHRSNWYDTGNYWNMPRAAVSYDGRFVVFSSNWCRGRNDVYVVAVP